MENEFCDTCCLLYNAVQNGTLGKLKKNEGWIAKYTTWVRDQPAHYLCTETVITEYAALSIKDADASCYILHAYVHCTACHDDAIKILLHNSNFETNDVC
jgi:hypothetical protein